MTPQQYRTAKVRLGLSHSGMARALGIGLRQSARYASGESPVATPVAKLIEYMIGDKALLSAQEQSEIISVLESALAKARRGEFLAVAVVAPNADNMQKALVSFAGALFPLAVHTEALHLAVMGLLYPDAPRVVVESKPGLQ